MLATNKVLRGRYRIIRQLGKSETSAVYKAFDSVRETNVALKEIIIDLNQVPTATEREILKREFANQAKNLAKVKHESLPQLRGYFSEIDRHYVVMELVEGEDAGELLAKNKNSLPFSDVAGWTDQLLDTLDYLHTLAPPIIHGDVKPQNVMLTSRGKIKLLGFDITAEDTNAKINPAAASPAAASAVRYSSLEQVLRTVDLTPQKAITDKYGEKIEKILSRPIDARSDVYALGATLYHLVTGRLPLAAMERTFSIWADKSDPLATPNKINQNISPEVSDVLMTALEIECENRFDSALAMRQALQTAVAEAQKREAGDAKKREEEAALEIRQAEQKRLEEERKLIEQERMQLEAAQKQQSELIAEQLRVAEAERQKAEQRAAEAEKLLSEKEAKKSVAKKDPATINAKSADYSAQKPFQPTVLSKSGKQNTSDVSKDLFTPQKPEGKPSWIMPAIVVAFLLVGGAVGFMMMRSSSSAESKQSTAIQPSSLTDKISPEQKVEAAPQQIVEKVSETPVSPETAPSVISPDKTSAPQSSFKNKPAAVTPVSPPRVVKPVAPPKAPANQKKAVTVDDLINGN